MFNESSSLSFLSSSTASEIYAILYKNGIPNKRGARIKFTPGYTINAYDANINSIIKMNSKEYTKRLAKEAVKTVDDLIAEGNPWKMLAYFNSDEMIAHKAPFVWALNPDDKNTKKYACYLSAHQFSILDLNVYFDDGKDVDYKKRYRKEFAKSCQKIFNTLLGANEFIGQDIYDVEVSIFDALGCIDVSEAEESTYNKINATECMSKYGFDWKEFTHCLGFTSTPSSFITSSKNYLKCGTDLYLANCLFQY